MADPADLADDFIQNFLADSLERQRNTKSSVPEAHGKCLWCEETITEGRRWCDTDCRDDWQREEDANRRRSGRAPVSMPVNEIDED